VRQDVRLMPVAVAALGGTAVGLHTSAPQWLYLLVLLCVIAAAIITIRGTHAVVIWLLVGCGMWASTALFNHLTHPDTIAVGHFAVVRGVVKERAEPWGTRCLVQIAPEHIDSGAPITLQRSLRIGVISAEACGAIAGQQLEATGTLEHPPFESRDAAHLKARSVRVWGEGTRMARWAAQISAALAAILADRPGHARALIPGVALGDDSQLTSELEEAMKVTQLAHLTAVSGGHISLLMGGAIMIVGRKNARLASLLGVAVLGALIALVGWEPSVVRAAGMAGVVLLALAQGRSTQAIPALSVTVIGVALADPWVATSYGFLLSASATAGIAICGADLRRRLSDVLPGYLVDAVAIPLAAQLACLPMLWTFADVGSVWGVLANVLTAPVVAPLTVGGIFGAILAPVAPQLAQLAIFPAQMATWWIDRVAVTLALWPGSAIGFGWTAAVLVMMYVVVRLRKVRTMALVTAAGIFASVVWPGDSGDAFPSNWVAIQCDVGQGAAFLIRDGHQTALIDVGPPGDAGAACVRAAGVEHVNVLVLSHFHADHVGGLPAVLEVASVDELWVSPAREPEENAAWVERLAAHNAISVREVAAGDQYGDWLDVVWPRAGYHGDANNSSVVVRAEVAGGIAVLGDVEEEAQRLIAPQLEEVAILVMAHHGSAHQDTGLARSAHPSLVFVSVGENSYGHPSARALELYSFAEIVATVECGSIAVDESGVAHSRCP
jgi:competence protein ComEC